MAKGDRGGVHKQLQNGKPLKAMRKWFKAGKPKDQFDSTWMGLDMLTFPTKHFGWKGITTTMKKVSYLSNAMLGDIHCMSS